MSTSLLDRFHSHSDSMLREILEDLLQRKRTEIVDKYSDSDTPFTDFIYADEDYEDAREAFITLEFYVDVCATVSEDHRVLVFDVLTKTFELSLRTALGVFKTRHKRGLHKCYQALEDYRRNFFSNTSNKVSKQDVSELLASHLAILARSN